MSRLLQTAGRIRAGDYGALPGGASSSAAAAVASARLLLQDGGDLPDGVPPLREEVRDGRGYGDDDA
eukprot:gene22390-3168_t